MTDWDDYIKVQFDKINARLSYRLGVPVINNVLERTCPQIINTTKYDQIEIHSFRLGSIATGGLRIHASARWNRFSEKTLGEPFKTRSTDCEIDTYLNVKVGLTHEIVIHELFVADTSCINSGFDLTGSYDAIARNLAIVLSGGAAAPGILDNFAGIGMLSYEFDVFRDAVNQFYKCDPVQISKIADDRIRFVKELSGLPDGSSSVFLNQIRCEGKGVWFDFQFEDEAKKQGKWLMDLFQNPPMSQYNDYLQHVKDQSERMLNYTGLTDYWRQIYSSAAKDAGSIQDPKFLEKIRHHCEWLLRHLGASYLWHDIHRSAMEQIN